MSAQADRAPHASRLMPHAFCLAELTIRDFAIVDRLRVEWEPGLNVLTGETGAGKSIIIDALGAALGGRFEGSWVRAGADRGSTEAMFAGLAAQGDTSAGSGPAAAEGLGELLGDLGCEGDDGTVILTRDISAARSVSRINGRAVPLAAVARIGQLLVDVHSQSSHLSLSRAQEHLPLLDRYARLGDLRSTMATAARALIAVRYELRTLEEGERQAQREAALLRHEVEEINAACIREGEDEELTARRARLRNAVRLRQLAEAAYAALRGSDEGAGALELLGEAQARLSEIRSLDPSLPEAVDPPVDLLDAAEDAARAVRGYADSVGEDPSALEEIEERLQLLADLKRRYGNTLAEVLQYGAEAEARLRAIDGREERVEELRGLEAIELRAAAEAATALSAARRHAARALEEAVAAELAELGMAGARFAVELATRPDDRGLPVAEPLGLQPSAVSRQQGPAVSNPAQQADPLSPQPSAVSRQQGPAVSNPVQQADPLRTQHSGSSTQRRVAFDETGIDRVELLISANPGEPLRPVGQVASGGELARLMLALKSALVAVDETPVLVFDELEQGVGGRTGDVIGEKLWRMARRHQVLCVTHLPQLATYADAHYSVTKGLRDGRATTAVARLEGEARVEELAQMLGGANAGPAARKSAEELLARAEEWKLRGSAALGATDAQGA